jgi:pyruvate,water dikinase
VFDERILNKSHIHVNGNVLNKKDVFDGIATSTGKIQGEVMIVDVPDDKLDTTGKILVTKSTDPGWVFLIQNAIGIIAEKGSLLSHTAIISRELHKPAVVNVKDCTKLLHNGDIVELDANDGIIKLVKRSEIH